MPYNEYQQVSPWQSLSLFQRVRLSEPPRLALSFLYCTVGLVIVTSFITWDNAFCCIPVDCLYSHPTSYLHAPSLFSTTSHTLKAANLKISLQPTKEPPSSSSIIQHGPAHLPSRRPHQQRRPHR
jgi:hypothetical protein